MSFLDEFKRLAHPYEDDEEELEEEYEEEYEEEEAEAEEAPRTSRFGRRPAKAERSAPRTGVFGGGAAPAQAQAPARDTNVVPLNNRAQVQVVLVKPEKYNNVSEVADHLLENRTVVLNLEKTDKAVSRRLLDFLSGVAYANHGKIQPIANATYLITPVNVEFQGSLKEEIERNGLFK